MKARRIPELENLLEFQLKALGAPPCKREYRFAISMHRQFRAELARQALELRAHTFGIPTMSSSASDFTLQKNMQFVLRCYIQIGKYPLRLQGEEA